MPALPELRSLVAGDFLRCIQCNKSLSDPVLLSCLHSVCSICVSQATTTTTGSGHEAQGKGREREKKGRRNEAGSLGVECAHCQAELDGEKPHVPHHFMRFLQELAECQDDSTKECDYCKYEDTETSAVARCIECSDNLCQDCADAHHRTKVTRHHKVVGLAEVQQGKYDTQIRANQLLSCPDHPDEPLKFYCSQCDCMICRECKVGAGRHEKHTYTDLSKAAQDFRGKISGMLGTVQGKIPTVEDYGKYLEKYEDHLQEVEETRTSEIQQQTERMHQMIDELSQACIKQVQSECQREKSAVTERQGQTSHVLTTLTGATDYIQQMMMHGTSTEVLDVKNLLINRLNSLAYLELEPIGTKLDIKFSLGEVNGQALQTLFGQLNIKNVPLNDKAPKVEGDRRVNRKQVANGPTVNGPQTPTASHHVPLMESAPTSIGENAKLIRQFACKSSSDCKDIWPTGIDIDTDGNLIVLDRENKRVKIFTEAGNLIREFGKETLGCPYDLVCMSDGKIAVSDYGDEEIKIFSRNGDSVGSLRGGFKYPRGITMSRQGNLIVVDCHNRTLSIHDSKNGSLLNKIDGKSTGQSPLFTDPYYVTTNSSGHIIVTDWAAPNIKIFDPSGKYITKYGSYGTRKDQVLQPYGVCTDQYGYIFVADNQNHRIHLLAPDGKFLRFVVSKQHGLWHPMAVTIDRHGNLVVTEALGKVKIFKYL